MTKTKNKPSSALEAKSSGEMLEIRWEKFDLEQFRKGQGAELVDRTKKDVTSCASGDPKMIERVMRAHLSESSDQATQSLQTKGAPKREVDSKRAMTQAEATAHFR
jgi:hypothetical protein